MPALQVKDCPQDVYDLLKLCAEAEDRSLSQQTLHILKEYLRARSQGRAFGHHEPGGFSSPHDPFRIEDPLLSSRAFDPAMLPSPEERARRREEVFKRIDAMEHPAIPDDFPSPVELIRKDRDSRPYVYGLDPEPEEVL